MPQRSRSPWSSLAGVLLAVDGVLALLLAAIAVYGLLFAIGDEGVRDDGPVYLTVLGSLLFGIACLALARGVARGDRRLRPIGIVPAGVILALVVSTALGPRSGDSSGLGLLAALGAVQAGIVLALLAWPGARTDVPEAAR